jgi:hypothetical protein
MAEGFLEGVVQRGGTNVEEGLHARTLVLFQRICCFLFRRLAVISLTALSTNAA